MLFGAPIVVVSAVLGVFAVADWFRFGRGIVRLSSVVTISLGDRAHTQAPPLGRSKAVLKVLYVAAPQAAWLVVLYLMVRWSIVVFLTVAGDLLDWPSRLGLALSLPDENSSWTAYVALVALGVLIALDGALISRNSAAASIATFTIMASRYVGAAVAGIFGVGGGVILALFIIVAMLTSAGGGEPNAMVPYISGAFTILVLAGLGFLTIFLGGAAVTSASFTLFPRFTVPDWFDDKK